MLAIGTSVFVAACATTKTQMSATDPFRINMQIGYNSTTPNPVPPPAGGWVDVKNWQTFLNTPAGGNAGLNPDNVFGNATQLKTKGFQGSKGLRTDGVVGTLTYNAAVTAGMPAYPKVP